MRINRYVALATGISRRSADKAINDGRIKINATTAQQGYDVQKNDAVTFDGHSISAEVKITTLILNKRVGFVSSRDGQGDKTIYDLIPENLHHLKPVGRLDKYSSGLLLMTNDGKMAHELTHPSFEKQKIYEIELNNSLLPEHRKMIQDKGVLLDDGPSSFTIKPSTNDKSWIIQLAEGRNRQIRRTFEALGYCIPKLHRVQFGPYKLKDIKPGEYRIV